MLNLWLDNQRRTYRWHAPDEATNHITTLPHHNITTWTWLSNQPHYFYFTESTLIVVTLWTPQTKEASPTPSHNWYLKVLLTYFLFMEPVKVTRISKPDLDSWVESWSGCDEYSDIQKYSNIFRYEYLNITRLSKPDSLLGLFSWVLSGAAISLT